MYVPPAMFLVRKRKHSRDTIHSRDRFLCPHRARQHFPILFLLEWQSVQLLLLKERFSRGGNNWKYCCFSDNKFDYSVNFSMGIDLLISRDCHHKD